MTARVPVCNAPAAALYLDPRGNVTPCCQAKFVLGNIGRARLPAIWRGARARRLRDAVEAGDLTLGCSYCAWRIAEQSRDSSLAVDFDDLDAPRSDASHRAPRWPQRIDFAISNTCNLACTMCHGDLSSTIRRHREGRPPLPAVYGDEFFDDLRPFLPHLVEARFLGGEPFLAAETFRVWDELIGLGLDTPCSVTTNGTQWNARVERVLDHLPVSVSVSIDGVTADTVERIRVNARLPVILENLGRFRAYTRERGTRLGLTFCLMRQNWHEFGDYLLFAEEWGARVSVNTVVEPAHSLWDLPADELGRVVAGLEARDPALRALALNGPVWAGELERLQSWRDRRGAGSGADGAVAQAVYLHHSRPSTLPAPLRAAATPGGGPTEHAAAVRAVEGMAEARVGVLRCSADDVVVSVGDGPDDDFLGLGDCVGQPFAEVVARLRARYGESVLPLHEEEVDGGLLRRAVYTGAPQGPTWFQGFAFAPGREGDVASITVGACTRHPPRWDDA